MQLTVVPKFDVGQDNVVSPPLVRLKCKHDELATEIDNAEIDDKQLATSKQAFSLSDLGLTKKPVKRSRPLAGDSSGYCHVIISHVTR